MISGGDFNRSIVVRFNAGGEVTIKQNFVGQDAEGYMRATMIVNGNIPSIPQDAKIQVDDYSEDFTRSAPGMRKLYFNAISTI